MTSLVDERERLDTKGVFNVGNGSSAETGTLEPRDRTLGSRSISRATATLDEATAALQGVALAANVEGSDWFRAARLLRSAALERRVVAPRVAGVALLLADALTFTAPDGVSLAQREAALRPGLKLLTEPFVSTYEESSLVDALLDNGWDVLAPFKAEAFVEFADAMPED